MQSEDDILADRLNYEPIILRGSTSSELVMILSVSAAFWVPMSFLIAFAIGAPMMGLGICGISILASVWIGCTLFQKVKLGRPDYYYQHKIMLLLDRLMLKRSGFVLRAGVWELGRGGRNNRLGGRL